MQEKSSKGVSRSTVIIICAFVFLAGLVLGTTLDLVKPVVNGAIQNAANSTSDVNTDFTLYWDVYNTLKQRYVDQSKLKKDELYYGSIRGMVESLGDPATLFFDPKETADYNKSRSGQYEGIGAELDFVNKTVVVVTPFDGSPAATAGLEAGDIILKVNGESTAGKTLNEVVLKIRGDAGTVVTLSIARPRENNKPYEIKITRGSISSPSMEIKSIKDGVAVVKINRFTDASYDDWKSNWENIATQLQTKIAKGEVKSLIIDLRGNPGGFFDAAVYLAGEFIPQGSVVSYQRDRDQSDQTFVTAQAPRFEKLPLYVLVNGSSASASEIFSGAMQFYKRATLIGEKTYGKGTAQIIIPMQDGSSLHVTITKWLLPDKRWINHDDSITPDKEIKFDFDAKAKGDDNQMDEAMNLAQKATAK